MRFYSSIVALLLSTLLLCGASAHAQKSSGKGAGRGEGMGRGEGKGKGQGKGKGSGEGKLSELTVPTTETVSVWLTTGEGNITVRGWDRKEVHAQAKEAGTKLELC